MAFKRDYLVGMSEQQRKAEEDCLPGTITMQRATEAFVKNAQMMMSYGLSAQFPGRIYPMYETKGTNWDRQYESMKQLRCEAPTVVTLKPTMYQEELAGVAVQVPIDVPHVPIDVRNRVGETKATWASTLDAFEDGHYVSRLGLPQANLYPCVLYHKTEKDYKYHSTSWVRINEDNLEGTWFYAWTMRARRSCRNGKVSDFIEVSSMTLNGVVVPTLKRVHEEDPIQDLLGEVIPFVLPKQPLADPKFDFQLLPEKIAIFDVELTHRFGPEPWCVGVVLMERGKITDSKMFYLQENSVEMGVRHIEKRDQTSEDTVRRYLLELQSQEYILVAKGYWAETQFLMGKNQGVKMKDYVFGNHIIYYPGAGYAHYAFAIMDVQMEQFEPLNGKYSQSLPAPHYLKAIQDYSYLKMSVLSHVPRMEGLVFLYHWKRMQDKLMERAHWSRWKTWYLKGEFPLVSRRVWTYWDERAQWVCLRKKKKDRQREQLRLQVLKLEQSEREYQIKDVGMPSWIHIQKLLVKEKVPRLKYGILTRRKISERDAEQYHKFRALPVSVYYRDSFTREQLLDDVQAMSDAEWKAYCHEIRVTKASFGFSPGMIKDHAEAKWTHDKAMVAKAKRKQVSKASCGVKRKTAKTEDEKKLVQEFQSNGLVEIRVDESGQEFPGEIPIVSLMPRIDTE